MGGFGGWVCVCVCQLVTRVSHPLSNAAVQLCTVRCVHVVLFFFHKYSPVRLRPPIRTRSSLWPLSRSSSLSRACDSFTTNIFNFFLVFRKGKQQEKTNNNQRRNDIPRSEKGQAEIGRDFRHRCILFLVIIIVITEKYKKKVDQLRISSAHSVGVF